MLKRENSISVSYKTKVARMLFIVVVVFIMLHIPFTVLIFIRTKLLKSQSVPQFNENHYLLRNISFYSLFLNAAVNPVIYGLTNDNFRRAYHQTPILPKQLTEWLKALKQIKYKKVDVSIQSVYIFSSFDEPNGKMKLKHNFFPGHFRRTLLNRKNLAWMYTQLSIVKRKNPT